MGEAMDYRVEIIANQSVEDDITDLLEHELPDIEYTVLPVVHGKGLRTKKLGTSIWPEQNFVLFSYISKENALKVKEIIAALKEKFPDEGISFFCTKEAQL